MDEKDVDFRAKEFLKKIQEKNLKRYKEKFGDYLDCEDDGSS